MTTTSSSQDDTCYICLQSEGQLSKPCDCPRLVHSNCLARWQAQKAGHSEERHCRFCHNELPPWTRALQDSPSTELPQAAQVHLKGPDGKTVMLTLERGPGAQERFEQRVREELNIEEDIDLGFTFAVQVPWKEGGTQPMVTDNFELVAQLAVLNASLRRQRDSQPASSDERAAKQQRRRSSGAGSDATSPYWQPCPDIQHHPMPQLAMPQIPMPIPHAPMHPYLAPAPMGPYGLYRQGPMHEMAGMHMNMNMDFGAQWAVEMGHAVHWGGMEMQHYHAPHPMYPMRPGWQ